MTSKVLNIDDEFIPIASFHDEKNGKFSHKIFRGHLKGSNKVWYSKEMKSPIAAKCERLAQEFIRLLLPHQPETRLLKNDLLNIYYIASEEVKNFRPLPTHQQDKFTNGTYSGLGKILLLAMLLQEIDLKNGNIGLDQHNRVVKIDGDWCFAKNRYKKTYTYQINQQSLQMLPYPKGFSTYNWLDLVTKEELQLTSSIIDPGKLSHSALFKKEVFHTLLKVILLPEWFIQKFVDCYMDAEASYYISEILSRKQRLLELSLELSNFTSYTTGISSTDLIPNYILQLQAFKFEGKQLFLQANQHEKLEQDIKSNFLNLKRFQLQLLLKKINSTRYGDFDLEMDKFINKIKSEIDETSDLDVLNNLLVKLQKQYINLINSNELNAIKHKISYFKENSHWYTVGMKNKSKEIESALGQMPIEQRHNILSCAEQNQVKLALAMHRHWGKRGMIYKHEDGTLNENFAASSYKELHSLFFIPDPHGETGSQTKVQQYIL